MGKYMKKSKIAGDVAVMEVSQSSCLGVRTRAKTLALSQDKQISYLQLRNRRLEKPPLRYEVAKKAQKSGTDFRSNEKLNSKSCSDPSSTFSKSGHGTEDSEASFGENHLDLETRERSTRESTPCSSIKDSSFSTTSSTTRKSASIGLNATAMSRMQIGIPSAKEMDEFFSGVESPQQRQFIEKYNFDFINDLPLPGRYEWIRVNP